MTLQEITDNLIEATDRYKELPLDDVLELSEILRVLDVNLSYLVFVRDEYYNKSQSVYFNSQAKTDAAKAREAAYKVPELDLARKILKHYEQMQNSIRSQISLRKSIDK